ILDLHSFPTRRSSDLEFRRRRYAESTIRGYSNTLFRLFDFYSAHNPTELTNKQVTSYAKSLINQKKSHTTLRTLVFVCRIFFDRSEEHTSELQSRENL